MTLELQTVVDSERGCGWRKPGGLYLVADREAVAGCGKLPIPLTNCPTCDAGVKFSRSWTWVNGVELAKEVVCQYDNCDCPMKCPLRDEEKMEIIGMNRVGLLWVGHQHYDKVTDFDAEAAELGISRRIKSIPRGFVPGDTWVWLAHIHAIPTFKEWVPGVFRVFQPKALQYVVKGDETDEELQKMINRGISPVRVVKDNGEAISES
jgi:hypothetical protein